MEVKIFKECVWMDNFLI